MTHSERIKSIRKRLRAATSWPWIYNSYSSIDADNEYQVASVPVVAGDTATKQGSHDAELIANSPADLEYLLTALGVAMDGLNEIAIGSQFPMFDARDVLQKIEGMK